jgi:hypothetical protein
MYSKVKDLRPKLLEFHMLDQATCSFMQNTVKSTDTLWEEAK